ncbi:MAG TPA: aconitate hydratase AcnA [Candidatus Latescibacteria bacterium]|nr:aconitate hydratase AcnA [Candidatus Handelsmanbacteria bacterium]HIL11591.1 aconitate hydratase AcnA [Candidatus Latescibacterota bacterium]
MADNNNEFGARAELESSGGSGAIYRIQKLEEDGVAEVSRLPFSIKILLEAALRQCDGFEITREDVERIARWSPETAGKEEIPFKPARVVMQDFTGVPAVVDLAVMRDAVVDLGGDPKKVNPLIPVDLVIDHSVQVDHYGLRKALEMNTAREFERNRERYEFLRWGQESFDNFRVVPPATGIVHQVNLEYLAQVVQEQDGTFFPDSLVGTDSHTTMINGLGVLGWGVGGIEAEAVMLGQPIYMLLPHVVGFKLTGEMPVGTTATDLVLTVVEMLRAHGVVGKFVEFYGPGMGKLSLADRATLANMAPEYGATMGLFPVDEETLAYMTLTGRKKAVVERVRAYMKAQGMLYKADSPDPIFSERLELDMATVVPSLAGPTRPQDRVALKDMKNEFIASLGDRFKVPDDGKKVAVDLADKGTVELSNGSVLIAAITSCTNTSNPSVMLGAGMLARNAAEKGLSVPVYVKTSLAPGSRVVTRYLDAAGVSESLDALGFHTVGYGCTTCIGNSGPLPEEIATAVADNDLVVCSVLSGNRNFEGRVHAVTRANFLASPPLVVAYALAGRTTIDFDSEPIGQDQEGNDVFLADIWPSLDDIRAEIARSLTPKMFEEEYGNVFRQNETWNAIAVPEGERYAWAPESTYIRKPTFFDGLTKQVHAIQPIKGARVLAKLADSVTTDHISPAGAIAPGSPGATYLEENGVERQDWNSYGSRRGNHEAMMRGTFANIRIRNELVPGVEGGYTRHMPSGEQTTIYEAAMQYIDEGVPSIILGGKEYGSGSSRDWAAKGPFLQGVKAVIVESYERIHRSNLIGMGILPLQFAAGEDRNSLGLTGEEVYDIEGLDDDLQPGQVLEIVAKGDDGEKRFKAICRIDTPVEINYYRNGGILHTVLRRMAD